MTYTENSYTFQFYLQKVNEGMDRTLVPNLFNLREVIYSVLDAE